MLTDVPPQTLHRVITDVNSWSRWDAGLEYTRMDGAVRPGATFILKPKGGPKVSMSIDDAAAHRLVDTAHLLGAKLRTTHEYIPTGSQTLVRFGIELWGPLALLWRKLLGESQIKEAPAQLAAFIAYARGRT
ncbi:MAG TPA: hypothetical protein VGJ12_03050 [Gemmatimonadaceae bacterium]